MGNHVPAVGRDAKSPIWRQSEDLALRPIFSDVAEQATRVEIDDTDAAVYPPSGGYPAGRGNRDRADLAVSSVESGELMHRGECPVVHAPASDGAIFRSREEESSIGRKSETSHVIRMALEIVKQGFCEEIYHLEAKCAQQPP